MFTLFCGQHIVLSSVDSTHGFNPLCVAPPLARKRASMYLMPPAGYRRIDPRMVIPMMYRSGK